MPSDPSNRSIRPSDQNRRRLDRHHQTLESNSPFESDFTGDPDHAEIPSPPIRCCSWPPARAVRRRGRIRANPHADRPRRARRHHRHGRADARRSARQGPWPDPCRRQPCRRQRWLAAVAVKRAEPDGYTLLMQYSGYHVITPHVVKQLAQWEAKDLQAVANVLSAPQVIVVREGLPGRPSELLAYARANPGKLSYASSERLAAARDRRDARAAGRHHDGACAVQRHRTGAAGLLGGQVDLTRHAAAVIPSSVGQAACAGRYRHHAPASRSDAPTAAEAGLPKLDATSWFGVFAPANEAAGRGQADSPRSPR